MMPTSPPDSAWTLVVLAAGLGRRYGAPKQLEPLGPSGETLSDYAVWDASRAGAGRSVFVVGPGLEPTWRRHHSRWPDGLPLRSVTQRPDGLPLPIATVEREKPWGTTHALLVARHEIRGPFAVANADDFYGTEAWRSIGDFLKEVPPDRPEGAVVGYRLRDTLSSQGGVSRAVLDVGPDGFLREVTELTVNETAAGSLVGTGTEGPRPLMPDRLVSMNLWAMTPAFLPLLERSFAEFLRERGNAQDAECRLPETVSGLIRSGEIRVQVLPTTAQWFGVTHPGDREPAAAALRERVARGDYPADLFAASRR